MKIKHFTILESGPTLGGFPVKPLNIEDQGVGETALNPLDVKGDLTAKRKALQDLSMTPGVDQRVVQQRKLDLEREAQLKNVEEASDISGLLAASRLNREFLITAKTAEGATKKFRVKAQSPRVAQEKFKQHYSMAEILNVTEVTDENKESTQSKFEKHLASHGYDVDERAAYWTNKLKELEAQRQKYIAQGTLKPDDVAPISEGTDWREQSAKSNLQPGIPIMVWYGPRNANPPRDDKKHWEKGVVVDSPEWIDGQWRVLIKTPSKGQWPINPERVFVLKQGVAEGDELNVGIEAYGVRGADSKKWRKTFKSQVAFEKWLDATEGDVEVLGTREINLNDMFGGSAGDLTRGLRIREQGVTESVAIVKQDYDLDQMVYVLNVDGNKVSFTYWDYEDDFNNPNIKDIYQQAQEQLGRKLSPEQVKAVARAVFKSFEQGVAEGSLEEYGDTAKGQKMLTKVQKRAVDRMIKADDKRDPKAAKKNQQTANRAWDRMTDKDVAEALKLDAPGRTMSRDELQAYAGRIKSGTKTKRDKFAPIIHASNIKAITKTDSPDTAWDLDDLAAQITQRPKAILGTNAKMTKSATEGEIVYDLTLPALSGIVVDEETGDFVEVTTCPGAGQCQLFCYARKGGYVMFPASSMSAAQALNFLLNDPQGYMAKVNQEIAAIKKRTDKAGIQLVVRWHDAGDFFSKEYLNLAFDIARANPEVKFYAYTKIADVATGDKPANFIINFSSGSKRGEEKKIEIYKQQGNVVKQGVTVPKDMFYDLIAREGVKLIKDEKGRTQFKSPEALEQFKQRLAQAYKVDPRSIITYDQMLATPVGNEPKWNVIVQPGAGDRAANRKDVIDSYLMFH